MNATELKDRLDRIQRLIEEAGEIIQEDYNKEKSAFLPYSCLDIIQLGMKKRTAVIYE